MTYWSLNTCIYNLQSCYEASRQNKQDKKEENLDIIKVFFVKIHVIESSCSSVTFFASFFINVLI